jgi:hypothetical protein
MDFGLSEQQLVEPAEADRFAAGERLAVAHANQLSPKSRPVANGFNNAGPALGLIIHQLRLKASQRRDLGIELVGNIQDDAGAFDNPKVDAEIVQNASRVEWIAWNV